MNEEQQASLIEALLEIEAVTTRNINRIVVSQLQGLLRDISVRATTALNDAGYYKPGEWTVRSVPDTTDTGAGLDKQTNP